MGPDIGLFNSIDQREWQSTVPDLTPFTALPVIGTERSQESDSEDEDA
jgi:hypothetical protein